MSRRDVETTYFLPKPKGLLIRPTYFVNSSVLTSNTSAIFTTVWTEGFFTTLDYNFVKIAQGISASLTRPFCVRFFFFRNFFALSPLIFYPWLSLQFFDSILRVTLFDIQYYTKSRIIRNTKFSFWNSNFKLSDKPCPYAKFLQREGDEKKNFAFRSYFASKRGSRVGAEATQDQPTG